MLFEGCRCVCSVDQRASLLRDGLGERSLSVQEKAILMLQTWLKDACSEDPVRLLQLLDVQSHEGTQLFGAAVRRHGFEFA